MFRVARRPGGSGLDAGSSPARDHSGRNSLYNRSHRVAHQRGLDDGLPSRWPRTRGRASFGECVRGLCTFVRGWVHHDCGFALDFADGRAGNAPEYLCAAGRGDGESTTRAAALCANASVLVWRRRQTRFARFASEKASNLTLCASRVRTNAARAQKSLIPVAPPSSASLLAGRARRDLQPIPIRHGGALPRRERKRSPRERNSRQRGRSSEPSSPPRAERRSSPAERASPRWRGHDRSSRGREGHF